MRFLRQSIRNEYVHATIILAAILCIAFSDVVFGGRTLVTSAYMAGVMPQGAYGYPHRHLLEKIDGFPRYDPASSAWLPEPNAVLTHNIYASGQLPLWNPCVGAGQPLAADLFSGIFYPLQYILYLWPRSLTWDFYYLLRLLIAGVLTYAYMREIRVGRMGSLAASMIFMLNGYFLGYLNMPHLNVEILIPALLLACEKILGGAKKTGILWGIFTIASCMVGGNPEAAFFALLFMSCYYLWRMVRPAEGEFRSAFRLAEIKAFLLMVIPGLALSAFLIIPFLELVSLGSHAHHKTVGHTVNYRLLSLITLFVPEFFGRTGILWPQNLITWCPAIGMGPLLLGLTGFSSEKNKRRLCCFFGVALMIFLLKAYGAPVINWIGYLPLFNQSYIDKYGFPPSMFGLAAAAGIGLETIHARGRLNWVLALIATSTFFLILCFYYQYITSLSPLDAQAVLIPGITKESVMIYTTVITIPFAVLSLAMLALMLAIHKKFLHPGLGAAVFFFLLFIEVGAYLFRLQNQIRYETFTKAPYIEFLQKDRALTRFIGMDLILPPANSGAFGLHDLGNFNAVCVGRHTDFMNRYYNSGDEHIIAMLRKTGGKPDLLDICNVKYVLSDRYFANASRFLVYDKEIRIYENPDFLPRAFLVDGAISVETPQLALEAVGSDSVDLRKTVVLENADSGQIHRTESTAVESSIDAAQIPAIEDYRISRIRIKTANASECYLVLLDTYYPGWKAFIDGVPTKIMPANYLFRAIRLPAGKHEVLFKYSPESYKIGLLVSMFGILATGWIALRTR
ncbi:YfhO family protein [Candidatus Poribacteria bacterium]|nr:YfhO family protein [Candidatus Poribacteria bacterium]